MLHVRNGINYMLVSKILNWEKIRAFGELQILTKASYIALILVPIIAGLWPSVRVAINHYNKAATEASIIFEQAHSNLSSQIDNIRTISNHIDEKAGAYELAVSKFTDSVEKQSDKLELQVSKFMSEFSPEQLDTPRLPVVWLYAFFGSLFVIIGHTFYQASAPDIVKKYTKMEFMDKAREDALKANLHLDEATQQALNRYEYVSEEGFLTVKLYASLFYLLGLICIGIVIYHQVLAVLKAAGY